MTKTFLILSACLATSACGAILNSGPQRLNFTSTPDSAEVWVDGVRRGTTPIFLELEKRKDHTVTFKKAGYQDFTNPVTRAVKGVYVVFDVLFGILPVVVDAATGSWYVLSTDHVHGTLQQTSGQLTPEQLEQVKQGVPLSRFITAESLGLK